MGMMEKLLGVVMDRQEAFNKAYLGVMKQGKLALDNEFCKYAFIEDGNQISCALGHCAEDFENALSWERKKYSPSVVSDILNLDFLFTVKLRLAHDSSITLGDFKSKMQSLAIEFKLEIPE